MQATQQQAAAQPAHLITTTHLGKKYGKRWVLEDVDFRLPRGAIYGLIGKNGAGKTTLMKILSGQIRQSKGFFAADQALRLGTLIESPALYPDMNARDNIKIKCLALGVRDVQKETDRLLALVKLQNTGSKRAGQFSLGMKQRLGLALAMVGSPEVLILDEPINGMDPDGIMDIRRLLVEEMRRGATILISSHILDELAKVATHLGFMKDGHLTQSFCVADWQRESETTLYIRTPAEKEARQALRQALQLDGGAEDGRLVFRGERDKLDRAARVLFDAGVYVEEIYVKGKSLEEFYLSSMGE